MLIDARTGSVERLPVHLDAALRSADMSNDVHTIDVAIEAARAAAAVLLPRFGSERAIASKSTATDLVSAADIEAEQAIRAVLAARVPGDAVVGEEGDATEGTSGRRWIVDPLDGTINYLYGIPMWCVSVACEGEAGVVYDPVRDELFAAEWNLLLWAAGSLSDVVCHHTMQVWRTAVDVGSRDRLRLDH